MCRAIAPGQAIKVRGVRPRVPDLVAAVMLETMGGQQIVDNGPSDDAEKTARDATPAAPERATMEIAGTVRRVLHGPKGTVRGVLLDDGAVVRLPKHAADGRTNLLAAGSPIAARGRGLATRFGVVIEAREIGPALDALEPTEHKKPKRKATKPDGDARQVA